MINDFIDNLKEDEINRLCESRKRNETFQQKHWKPFIRNGQTLVKYRLLKKEKNLMSINREVNEKICFDGKSRNDANKENRK